MQKNVYFVAPADFGDGVHMNEVYCMADDGRLAGGLYTKQPVAIGDAVDIQMQVRDGKFKLRIAQVIPGGKPKA